MGKSKYLLERKKTTFFVKKSSETKKFQGKKKRRHGQTKWETILHFYSIQKTYFNNVTYNPTSEQQLFCQNWIWFFLSNKVEKMVNKFYDLKNWSFIKDADSSGAWVRRQSKAEG